jgi:hypothetical protein
MAHPDLFGHAPRGNVSLPDQAHQPGQAEMLEGVTTHGGCRLRRESLVPAVTAEVIPELNGLVLPDVHPLQATVADDLIPLLVNNGEESVAVRILMREITLHPVLHLREIKRRLVECRHDPGVTEDAQERRGIFGSHRPEQEPGCFDHLMILEPCHPEPMRRQQASNRVEGSRGHQVSRCEIPRLRSG